MVVLRDNKNLKLEFSTRHYYSIFYSTVASIVGIMFMLVAIIVYIKCDNNELAKVFHWSFVFTAMIILLTWGNYSILPYNLGKITRVGFHIGYLFAPVFFLRFSIVFPSKLKLDKKHIFTFLYIIAAILSMSLSYLFLKYSDLPPIAN